MSNTDSNLSIDEEIIVTIDPGLEHDLLDGKGGAEVRKSEHVDPLGDLKDQFQALQSTVSTTQQRLAQTEQERDELARTAKALETEVVTTRKDSVEQGIAAAKSDGDAAEKEYATAMEAGDFAAAARAQRRMAQAETNIARLSDAKDDLDVAAQPARKAPVDKPAPVDKAEAYINRFTGPSQTWLRAHKDFVTDEAKNAKLVTAHHVALHAGYTADTPEYFEAVEKNLGLRQDAKTPGRRPVAPAAPVTASGGGMGGNSGNEVRLSKKEADAAVDGTHTWTYDDPTGKARWKKGDAIGVQEFARRKRLMTAEGRYDRTLSE